MEAAAQSIVSRETIEIDDDVFSYLNHSHLFTPCYDSPMAKDSMGKDVVGGKLTLTSEDGGKHSSRAPVTLEVGLQGAAIRVSLCQGDQKVDLPLVQHIVIDPDMPDFEGKTRSTITFGNGELKWIGPEPLIKE
jgi:hypothetical protein